MKFLGRSEVASFLRVYPGQAETLQAWLAEIRHRNWPSPEAFSKDFPQVDTRSLPFAVFRLGRPALKIETLVDFRNGIVLLTEIRNGNDACIDSLNES